MKITIFASLIALIGFAWVKADPQIGAKLTKLEMEKYKESPNYTDGRFVNLEETPVMNPESSTFKIMKEFMKKGVNREPEATIQTQKFDKNEFLSHKMGLTYSWFGHSTILLNIDGVIILCDPFFSERASPVSFVGTKKFSYTNDIQISDLPHIDLVLISHDHYDHLDSKSIKELESKADKFLVPLGVAAHLIRWKIDKEKIVELDWWENYTPNSSLDVTAAPARHFSGRSLKRNTTLWCSFVIKVKGHNIYFSGDSGYGQHFKQIGDKFGPFDLAFIECGQYNKDWSLIHMSPNETYLAFKDLKGKKMTPLHWGKFKLSLHPWTEPVDMLLESANGDSQQIIIPEIGELVQLDSANSRIPWWK